MDLHVRVVVVSIGSPPFAIVCHMLGGDLPADACHNWGSKWTPAAFVDIDRFNPGRDRSARMPSR